MITAVDITCPVCDQARITCEVYPGAQGAYDARILDDLRTCTCQLTAAQRDEIEDAAAYQIGIKMDAFDAAQR